jgi:hypothetical protein
VFEKLPKTCDCFDQFEDIPEDDRFHVKGIVRNRSDVCTLRITCGGNRRANRM